MKKAFPLAIAAAGLLLSPAGASAEKLPGLSSLQGAWVEQSTDCEHVYRPAKRGMAFRRDVSGFTPAFIISGRRITTPWATCSIHSISYKATRMTLHLGCTTSITTSPIKAYFSTSSDGALYRYNDDGEKTGSKYELCKP